VISVLVGAFWCSTSRASWPASSTTLFAVYLGVLMWVGMVLRRPELLRVAGLTR
jgi:hypothetical protein